MEGRWKAGRRGRESDGHENCEGRIQDQSIPAREKEMRSAYSHPSNWPALSPTGPKTFFALAHSLPAVTCALANASCAFFCAASAASLALVLANLRWGPSRTRG